MNLMQYIMILSYGILAIIYFLTKEKKVFNEEKSLNIAIIDALIANFIGIITIISSKEQLNILSVILASITNFYFSYNLALGKIKIKMLVKAIATILIFLTSSIYQLIPIRIFNITESVLTNELSTYLTAFSDISILIILIIMYYDDIKRGILKAKENFSEFFDTSFRIWLIGFLGMVISNLIINFLFPSAISGNENAVQDMIDVSPFIMLICAGIVAPIIEELTFRKAFQNIFNNKWVFILVSGIIFGGLHVIFSYESLIDFVYVIPYSVLGISFAYMLDKTDNIMSSIMMHFIHNTMIISFSILTGMILL